MVTGTSRSHSTVIRHACIRRAKEAAGPSFLAFRSPYAALSAVTHLSLPDAAILAAFVFGLSSALTIWLAVREVFGARLADRAVLLYVFCPTAYVLSLAYTEGLFLTAAAVCLFALSRRYWITAALCACVAGLTRNTGLAVMLAVLVTTLPAAGEGGHGGPPSPRSSPRWG